MCASELSNQLRSANGRRIGVQQSLRTATGADRTSLEQRHRQAPPPVENSERLARMEQAIDSIAIEIERVSEGQRFVARLMSERQPAALGTGQPVQPTSMPVAGKVAVPR